jgi:carbon storage regulator
MLVLSRKPGQIIEIAGGIRVKVVAVNGSRVKIGIDAPLSVDVTRSEVSDCLGRSVATSRVSTSRLPPR